MFRLLNLFVSIFHQDINDTFGLILKLYYKPITLYFQSLKSSKYDCLPKKQKKKMFVCFPCSITYAPFSTFSCSSWSLTLLNIHKTITTTLKANNMDTYVIHLVLVTIQLTFLLEHDDPSLPHQKPSNKFLLQHL